MSGPNHITGGLIFTGIFASFWNINIFSRPEYMSICAITSILPDIDHVKSPIGKIFYPVSTYLDQKFGHRTITHSLLFFITLLLIISILEKVYTTDLHISLISTFGLTSHLIFDMMTEEGVPLLYPFNKTPCVIPANTDRRLRSGDFKTECIIFCLFIAIGFSCKSLFENGFWTTFDRVFGTIKHINHEFIESDQLIKLDYKATRLGKEYKGQGYIVYSDKHKLIIFNNTGFIELNDAFQISQLEPTKTAIQYKTKDLYFNDINPGELQKLLYDKPILKLHIQANTPISYKQDNQICTNPQVSITYTYNPLLTWVQEEDPALKTKKETLEYKLQTLLKERTTVLEKEERIKERIKKIIHTTPRLNDYNRQKATEELRALKSQLEKLNIQQCQDKIDQVHFNLSQLKSKPNPICSGYIQYLILPYNRTTSHDV